jgi:hypothetical protein
MKDKTLATEEDLEAELSRMSVRRQLPVNGERRTVQHAANILKDANAVGASAAKKAAAHDKMEVDDAAAVLAGVNGGGGGGGGDDFVDDDETGRVAGKSRGGDDDDNDEVDQAQKAAEKDADDAEQAAEKKERKKQLAKQGVKDLDQIDNEEDDDGGDDADEDDVGEVALDEGDEDDGEDDDDEEADDGIPLGVSSMMVPDTSKKVLKKLVKDIICTDEEAEIENRKAAAQMNKSALADDPNKIDDHLRAKMKKRRTENGVASSNSNDVPVVAEKKETASKPVVESTRRELKKNQIDYIDALSKMPIEQYMTDYVAVIITDNLLGMHSSVLNERTLYAKLMKAIADGESVRMIDQPLLHSNAAEIAGNLSEIERILMVVKSFVRLADAQIYDLIVDSLLSGVTEIKILTGDKDDKQTSEELVQCAILCRQLPTHETRLIECTGMTPDGSAVKRSLRICKSLDKLFCGLHVLANFPAVVDRIVAVRRNGKDMKAMIKGKAKVAAAVSALLAEKVKEPALVLAVKEFKKAADAVLRSITKIDEARKKADKTAAEIAAQSASNINDDDDDDDVVGGGDDDDSTTVVKNGRSVGKKNKQSDDDDGDDDDDNDDDASLSGDLVGEMMI